MKLYSTFKKVKSSVLVSKLCLFKILSNSFEKILETLAYTWGNDCWSDTNFFSCAISRLASVSFSDCLVPPTLPSKQGWIRTGCFETKYDTAYNPPPGPTHEIFPFLPFHFLNYFRLPSIYISLYIDIHIEYTYINCVTPTSLRSLA